MSAKFGCSWWVMNYDLWMQMPFRETNEGHEWEDMRLNYYQIVEQYWAIREGLAESPAKAGS